jgi:hypothetical protein
MDAGKVLYPMQKNLTLKARQENPGSPPELIRQYQVVTNVLHHYLLSSGYRVVIPNDDYFFLNVHKAPRFSIVVSWTNVKKLLKRRT